MCSRSQGRSSGFRGFTAGAAIGIGFPPGTGVPGVDAGRAPGVGTAGREALSAGPRRAAGSASSNFRASRSSTPGACHVRTVSPIRESPPFLLFILRFSGSPCHAGRCPGRPRVLSALDKNPAHRTVEPGTIAAPARRRQCGHSPCSSRALIALPVGHMDGVASHRVGCERRVPALRTRPSRRRPAPPAPGVASGGRTPGTGSDRRARSSRPVSVRGVASACAQPVLYVPRGAARRPGVG